MAALFTLDALANAIAGRNSGQGRIIRAWAGDNAPLDTGREAFVMGALTHILEVDDLHKASVVHPGCVVVPAAWAVARKAGADGRALLHAVIRGFEAAARVGMAVGPKHYEIWHNTATCGPFGAAAAAGSLLGLDEAQMTHALGNAGTQSAGLWQFLETGAMSKHLHAGRGAEAGVVAAQLAAKGFTGSPQILEGKKGFFAAMCPDARPEMVLADPDHRWQVHETSIKPWPSCRHTHPGIDAGRELRGVLAAAGKSADDIASVELEVYQAALNLCDNPDPQSTYEAKFSLQHTIAAALTEENVTFASFDAPAREALAPLRAKVAVRLGPAIEAAYPVNWGCRLAVTLRDNNRLEASRIHALGDPELPLSEAQLVAKAEDLMRHGGMSDPALLADAILGLSSGGPLPVLPI